MLWVIARSYGPRHLQSLRMGTLSCELRESSDEEEADDSEPVVPMTLREARGVGHVLKIFVQENQDTEAMHPHLRNIEALVRDMEAMTVSVRTQQTKVTRFFMPERAADGSTPTAGAGAE